MVLYFSEGFEEGIGNVEKVKRKRKKKCVVFFLSSFESSSEKVERVRFGQAAAGEGLCGCAVG